MFLALGCSPGEITGPGGSGPGGNDNPGVDAGSDDPVDPPPGAPDAAPPDYSLSIGTPTTQTILGTTSEIEVVLQSDNFQGTVALTAADVPATWEVSFSPAIVSMPRNGSATTTMQVTIPSNGIAGTNVLTVNASGAPGIRTGTATLEVANEVVVTLAPGTGQDQHNFPEPLEINLGTKVTIANADTTAHRIHSGNDDAGFPHQPSNMGEGEGYSFTLTRSGSFNYYCHVHDVAAGVGRIVVSE
jgi:plastocyanin